MAGISLSINRGIDMPQISDITIGTNVPGRRRHRSEMANARHKQQAADQKRRDPGAGQFHPQH